MICAHASGLPVESTGTASFSAAMVSGGAPPNRLDSSVSLSSGSSGSRKSAARPGPMGSATPGRAVMSSSAPGGARRPQSCLTTWSVPASAQCMSSMTRATERREASLARKWERARMTRSTPMPWTMAPSAAAGASTSALGMRWASSGTRRSSAAPSPISASPARSRSSGMSSSSVAMYPSASRSGE
jgi:hypothetical protein